MPKGVYRSIGKSFPGHGENIVWISGENKSAAYTSKQAKKYLLCENCEQIFSKKGEDRVLALMAKRNGFKLATKIKKFKELATIEGETWCFPPNKDLASSFMYFAVSIVWRLSITDWSAYGLSETKNSILIKSMNSFSEFLLGKSEMPQNKYLGVYVDNQVVDSPAMSFPAVKNHQGYQHIVFNIPGLKFSILTGDDHREGIREMFSLNKMNVYFISRSLKTHPDYHFMTNFLKNEAIPKGRLAKEFSEKNV